jgi:hypothetical protein
MNLLLVGIYIEDDFRKEKLVYEDTSYYSLTMYYTGETYDYYFKTKKFRVIDLDTLDVFDITLDKVIKDNITIRHLFIDYYELNTDTEYIEINVAGFDEYTSRDKELTNAYMDIDKGVYHIHLLNKNENKLRYVCFRTIDFNNRYNDVFMLTIDVINGGVSIGCSKNSYILTLGKFSRQVRYNNVETLIGLDLEKDISNFVKTLGDGVFVAFNVICFIDKKCDVSNIVIPDGVKYLISILSFSQELHIVIPKSVEQCYFESLWFSKDYYSKGKLTLHLPKNFNIDIIRDIVNASLDVNSNYLKNYYDIDLSKFSSTGQRTLDNWLELADKLGIAVVLYD